MVEKQPPQEPTTQIFDLRVVVVTGFEEEECSEETRYARREKRMRDYHKMIECVYFPEYASATTLARRPGISRV